MNVMYRNGLLYKCTMMYRRTSQTREAGTNNYSFINTFKIIYCEIRDAGLLIAAGLTKRQK